MADSSRPKLVITELWDFDTDTVRDVTLRIIDAREVKASVGAGTSSVGVEAGVGNAPPHVDPGLIGTRLPTAEKAQVITREQGTWPRFEAACRPHLGPDYEGNKGWLLNWHDNHMGSLESPGISGFMAELEESVAGTPRGRQRRAASADNSNFVKLSSFLDKLYQKYKMQSENT